MSEHTGGSTPQGSTEGNGCGEGSRLTRGPVQPSVPTLSLLAHPLARWLLAAVRLASHRDI